MIVRDVDLESFEVGITRDEHPVRALPEAKDSTVLVDAAPTRICLFLVHVVADVLGWRKRVVLRVEELGRAAAAIELKDGPVAVLLLHLLDERVEILVQVAVLL